MAEGRAQRFDWDAGNIDHIALHGVEPEEAEEALLDRRRIPRDVYSTPTERRYGIVGVTAHGRLLLVVYTHRRGMTRVVSARGAIDEEKRAYRRRNR